MVVEHKASKAWAVAHTFEFRVMPGRQNLCSLRRFIRIVSLPTLSHICGTFKTS